MWRSQVSNSVLVTGAVFLVACSSFVGETPVETVPPTTTLSTTTTTTSGVGNPSACVADVGGAEPIDTGSPVTDALSLSKEIFLCAPDVVVVGDGLSAVAAAAQLAAVLHSPLLLPQSGLTAELERLDAERVHLVGLTDVPTPASVETISYDAGEAVGSARQLIGATTVARADDTTSTVSDTILAIDAGEGVVIPAEDRSSIDAGSLVAGLSRSTEPYDIWLVDATDPVTALIAAPAAKTVGASVVAVEPSNLFRYPESGEAIAGYPDRSLRPVGFSELNDWMLRTLAGGRELPGGGFELFPEYLSRRLVAFYGTPISPALGAMGQVSPNEALSMMSSGGTLTGYVSTGCLPSPCQGTVPPGLLDGYGADGAVVVPTFNYIASVAQPRCGTEPAPISTFQDGIDLAGDVGGYVMFDLQPGSEDFLTQAKFYENALRLPFVGLAIDPEWHCGWPGQTTFGRGGTVTAAEINEVIDWIAELVNREGLPQKLVLIQQFRLDMIQDRDQIIDRPEVQVVIQMDGEGQGSLASKDDTWAAVTANTEDHPWRWGWKNFFVRDHPNGPYSPEETLDRSPVPVYISYQ